MVNGNFRRIDPGDVPSGRKRLRRGDWVRRRNPRPDQAPTGVVVHVNRMGVLRLRVLWTDNTESNVSVRSVDRIQ
jgi:hypothetical protein